VYFRALPVDAIGQSTKIGEDAASALFGPTGVRLIALTVLISTFGCIGSSIVGASRLGFPMAQDRVFFKQLAWVHPRYQTPAVSIVVLGVWSCVLVVSGSYEQLFDYSLFASFIFHAATGAAMIRLRRSRPDLERPYRTHGYPVVPIVFVVAMVGLVANTLVEKPVQSLLGVGLVALGVPLFLWMRHRAVPETGG
jgi:basic amino acid/polyamine antiporter, APA family